MKQNRAKRITKMVISLLLGVCLMMQLLVGAASANSTGESQVDGTVKTNSKAALPANFSADMQAALEEAEQLLFDQKPFSDWAVIGFAKNGRSVPKGFLEEKADVILSNGGNFEHLTDLTRTAIAYAAAGGGNINFIAGIDLVTIMMNRPGLETKGVVELVTTYIASKDSGSYAPYARPNWYPDALLHFIRELQQENGSWPSIDAGEGTVEATALALITLSPSPWIVEPEESEEVRQALAWLHAQQTVDGGFEGSTAATAEVIIALSSNRIDAATFALPGGGQPLEYLMSRRLTAGGFSERGDGVLNMSATLNAYLALTAYKLYLNGEKRLIDGLNSSKGIADIQIEGPTGTIAQGSIPSGGKAIDAALSYLKQEGIDFKTETDSAGMQMISSLAGIDAKLYGGENRWRLAMYRGSWMLQENAEVGLHLSDGSRLLLYYGSENTNLIDSVEVEWTYENGQTISGRPFANTPFIMYVTKSNRKLGGLPAPGITVTLNGEKKVTDAKGKVAFAGQSPGVHVVTLTGYRNGAAPEVAKNIYHLTVSAPELASFDDHDKVADWAIGNMVNALTYGYIQGVSAKANVLAPKKALTRAEFVTMLLRLVHGFTDLPVAASPFNDVPASKWYSDEIGRAAELGITDRKSGQFEPERAITREEAAIMSANAGSLATYGSAKRMAFSDIAGLSADSLHAIQAVNEHKVMIGSDGKFSPKQTLIREQAAAILARLHWVMYPETFLDWDW